MHEDMPCDGEADVCKKVCRFMVGQKKNPILKASTIYKNMFFLNNTINRSYKYRYSVMLPVRIRCLALPLQYQTYSR